MESNLSTTGNLNDAKITFGKAEQVFFNKAAVYFNLGDKIGLRFVQYFDYFNQIDFIILKVAITLFSFCQTFDHHNIVNRQLLFVKLNASDEFGSHHYH